MLRSRTSASRRRRSSGETSKSIPLRMPQTRTPQRGWESLAGLDRQVCSTRASSAPPMPWVRSAKLGARCGRPSCRQSCERVSAATGVQVSGTPAASELAVRSGSKTRAAIGLAPQRQVPRARRACAKRSPIGPARGTPCRPCRGRADRRRAAAVSGRAASVPRSAPRPGEMGERRRARQASPTPIEPPWKAGASTRAGSTGTAPHVRDHPPDKKKKGDVVARLAGRAVRQVLIRPVGGERRPAGRRPSSPCRPRAHGARHGVLPAVEPDVTGTGLLRPVRGGADE